MRKVRVDNVSASYSLETKRWTVEIKATVFVNEDLSVAVYEISGRTFEEAMSAAMKRVEGNQ